MNEGVTSCPGGQQVTSMEECAIAYEAIKNRYHLDMGSSHMKTGAFDEGEPIGCSVMWNKSEPVGAEATPPPANALDGTIFGAPGSSASGYDGGWDPDQPPYWNTAETSSNSLVSSGEMRVLCSQVDRYSGEVAPGGPPGIQGEKGPPGPMGTIMGPYGETGRRGAPGPVGEKGPPGHIGKKGVKGPLQATGIPKATPKSWMLGVVVGVHCIMSYGVLFVIQAKFGAAKNKAGDTVSFM